MSKQSRSIKNLFYAVVSQVVTLGFGLLLPRLFVTSYGSEVNGLLSSLQQLLVYLGLFEAGVGAATMQALYRPIAEDNWDDINSVLSATNVYYKKTGQWYFVALIALSVLYPLVVKCELPFWMVCGAVFFSGIGNVVLYYVQGKYSYFLQAEGREYLISNLTTVTQALVSLAKVVLILMEANIVVVLATAFLISCFQAVYILWYVYHHYPRMNLRVSPNYRAIGQKNYALGHQVSGLIFNNTDVLILTILCDLRVVSVYSMYKLVTSHLESLLGIFVNSIRFLLGQTYQTDKRRYIRLIDLVESYYSAIVYSVFSVTLVLFLPFMRLYTIGVTDSNYVDGPLAVLFVITSLLHLSRTPMLGTINFAGHYQQTLSRSMLESAINLIVSLVGVYFLGIYGVLLGTVAALAYRTNDIILYANHKLLHRSAKRTYAIYGADMIMFALVVWLLNFILGYVEIDSYLQFILVGAVSVFVAVLIFVLGQTILFGHCRSVAKKIIKSTKSTRTKRQRGKWEGVQR